MGINIPKYVKCGWIIKNKKKFLLITNQSDEMKYRMEEMSNKICKTKLCFIVCVQIT